jgi:hypothetical protein
MRDDLKADEPGASGTDKVGKVIDADFTVQSPPAIPEPPRPPDLPEVQRQVPGPSVEPSAPPPSPPPSARRTAAWLGGAVALVLALIVVAWRFATPPRAPSSPGQAGGPGFAAANPELAKGTFNVVLQVRAEDPAGGTASVGTTLPRRLLLSFADAGGKSYAEYFDRVGLWAIEMEPGTYWIPASQPGLGEWKWKVAGEGLVRDGDKGWRFTLKAGEVHPMIDLLLY